MNSLELGEIKTLLGKDGKSYLEQSDNQLNSGDKNMAENWRCLFCFTLIITCIHRFAHLNENIMELCTQ